MSATSEYYLAQAEQNALAAANTDLPNVRDRCLRAEAAWRSMAERINRVEQNKQARVRIAS